ncbi:class I SAM-dependent rRNA methyltransferase [Thiomicrorhabdus aquaedulcis]|uniref:class I SAM-dependent rRNA methyltransferase n=1 Tax=Thiomicrorhabdus aquaedulcis TaxID=2211106 RepID=UPI000FDBD94C|nr:class I SAM-dependent rRNA methyltransferase [Thiomicrorhabdus aquaedulcis]
MYPSLKLKKNEERRIKQGHVWVFSNEVDNEKTPLKEFTAGQRVVFEDSAGKPLGMGYVNPNTLICGRLLSRSAKLELNLKFFKKRLQEAQALRELHFDQPFYRLVFGEGDGLPGLVIDRFGAVFVVQITTAGMELAKDDIIQVLINLYHPDAIVMRNDSASRQLEGLPLYEEVVFGELPEQIEIVENNTRFIIPVVGGQKTGWFYDHRMARARLQTLVKGKRVLDVFSYLGGWGVAMATAGAESVTCVDSSEFALDGVDRNAALNGVSEKMTTIQGNAFDVLNALRMEGEKFDVVIIDPPAFVKRKKDFKAGFEAYRRINEIAMRVLAPDGILVSASCSHHLTRDNLVQAVQSASRHIDRNVQLFEQGHQGPDHPVHPAIPETEYIKTLFFRVIASW